MQDDLGFTLRGNGEARELVSWGLIRGGGEVSVRKGENRGEKEGLVCPAPRPSHAGTLCRGGTEWQVYLILSASNICQCNDGAGAPETKRIW